MRYKEHAELCNEQLAKEQMLADMYRWARWQSHQLAAKYKGDRYDYPYADHSSLRRAIILAGKTETLVNSLLSEY